MLLNLMSRNLLIKILPNKGSISDQLICKEIINRLFDISEEHKQLINFKNMGNGSFKYDIEKDEPIEFNFSEPEKYILKRGVDLLDKSESVTPDILEICLMINDL